MTKVEIKKLQKMEAECWDKVMVQEETIATLESSGINTDASKYLHQDYVAEWCRMCDVLQLLGIKKDRSLRKDRKW